MGLIFGVNAVKTYEFDKVLPVMIGRAEVHIPLNLRVASASGFFIVFLSALLLVLAACSGPTDSTAADPDHIHDWSEWSQTVPPTCTSAGVETRTCAINASHIEKRTGTPALGHLWGDWKQTTDPDCTTIGEETRVCARDPSHTENRPLRLDIGLMGDSVQEGAR